MVTYLGSLVQLCCKQISLACVGSARSVCTTLGLPQLTVVCAFPVYTAQAPIALQGNSPKWALLFVYFPGLTCSGSGPCVLHKDTDSVGSALCALPRSEQLRQPGAWRVRSPRCAGHLITSRVPAARFPGCTARTQSQVCHVFLLEG